MVNNTIWVDVAQACKILKVKKQTMSHWRKIGYGPAFLIDVRGKIGYRLEDVKAWAACPFKFAYGQEHALETKEPGPTPPPADTTLDVFGPLGNVLVRVDRELPEKREVWTEQDWKDYEGGATWMGYRQSKFYPPPAVPLDSEPPEWEKKKGKTRGRKPKKVWDPSNPYGH